MALLVKAAKGHSVSILPITTPLIAAACRCGSLSSRNSNNSINSSGSGRRDSTRAGGGTPSSCNNGFLAKDGLALWLAVMQNITESQYATYHVELQNLVCGAMAGLNISPSRAEAAPSGAQSVTQRWNIFAEADSAELITSLMQVVEAYALLGGEAHCILLDAQCRAALTSLYCGALGKVEAKLVQFVVRPLQALLMCCPILAGQFYLIFFLLQV